MSNSNHPNHFEQALQSNNVSTTTCNNNFTWLVFVNSKWVPFASSNQHKLEQTLGLGGTFIDLKDGLFPAVKRVRVFPKANYLSYLGVKYRLSRVMQPNYHGYAAPHITEQEEQEQYQQDPAMNRLLPPGFMSNNGRIIS